MRSVAFSPDGLLRLASGGDDGAVRLRRIDTGDEALVLRPTPGRGWVALDPAGNHKAADAEVGGELRSVVKLRCFEIGEPDGFGTRQLDPRKPFPGLTHLPAPAPAPAPSAAP